MRLDKRRFERWLRSKQPEEIVGHNRDCHSCPIALFYHEVSKGIEIIIFGDENRGGYIVDRGYIRTKPPVWAENFMLDIDSNAKGKITAASALVVLARS